MRGIFKNVQKFEYPMERNHFAVGSTGSWMTADEGRIRTHRPNNHLNLVVWSEIVRIGRRRTRWRLARTRTTQQATAETFSTCCGYTCVQFVQYPTTNILRRFRPFILVQGWTFLGFFFRKLLTAVGRSDRCHSFITVMMNNTLYTIYLPPFSSSFALGIKRWTSPVNWPSPFLCISYVYARRRDFPFFFIPADPRNFRIFCFVV